MERLVFQTLRVCDGLEPGVRLEKITLMMNDQTDEANEQVNLRHSKTSELSAKNHLEHRTSLDSVNTASLSERSTVSAPKDYSFLLTILFGSVLSVGMLLPLGVLPGLIVFVLPAEIYVLGQVYDSISEFRSRNEALTKRMAVEQAHEENEKARVRVYGAHFAP